jgi:transcriptional regulator with PAS, ATPase and Fis domain
LVVTGVDLATGVEVAEIVHETLIQKWGKLRAWIEKDRELRSWQERLRSVMREWEKVEEDSDLLLRGRQLEEAQSWTSIRAEELSEAEKQFIEESLAKQRSNSLKRVLGINRRSANLYAQLIVNFS